MFLALRGKLWRRGCAAVELAKILLASVLSYGALFICAKVVGRKQISQLDFMDYITGITIGSIAAELATDLENMWKPLVAMAVYTLATWAMARLSMALSQSRKYLNGSPVIVLDNGKLYRENMRQAKLELSDFMVMCRQQGFFNLADIQTAVYEYNGRLTILPVSARRPLTPEDMKLQVSQEHFLSEVIMDGRVLGENLHRMGLDEKWLARQLRSQGIGGPEQVFLALCDREKNLSCYPMES